MSTTNDPLKVLQDEIDKNQTNLASEQDPYAKPLMVQYAGLAGSISKDVSNVSTWDKWNDQIKFDQEAVGLKTLKAFDGLNFNVVDDSGSRFYRGYSGMEYMTKSGSSQGWGERNRLQEQTRLNEAQGKAEGFILPSDEAYSWSEKGKGWKDWSLGIVEGFEKWFHETDLQGDYERLKTKMNERDNAWTEEKKAQTFEAWKSSNKESYDFMVRAGVNFNDYVSPTLNETAFNVGIMEAAKQAVVNQRMQMWEQDHSAPLKFMAGALEGFKDPLMARDIIATTILTAGLGTLQAVGTELAVAGVEGAEATLKVSQVAKAAAQLQKLTGPMTGLLEGPLYAGLKGTIFQGAGRNAAQTLMARGLAMFGEGTVQGLKSSLADQKDEYDWRSLVFKDTDKAFEYDYGGAISQGATSGLGAMAMLGVMRFGLGALGDYKYYRKGDWTNWRKGVANSLDGWATTKEGLIVYGEELSDGRGVAFGNMIDKYMAGKDGRNFTNVMLNGDRLFGRLDSTIAAKMNLDTLEALKVADALEKATGIAGEAAMRRVEGVDPHMSAMFMNLLDKKFLEEHGLTYDDAVKTIESYREFSTQKGMFPLPATSEGRLLTDLSKGTKKSSQEMQVRHIGRLIDTKILDRRVEQVGISGSSVLSEAEGIIGRRLDIMNDSDFGTYRTTAGYLAGAHDEENVFKQLNAVMSSTEPEINIGGRVIPTETAKQIFRSALGLGMQTESRKSLLHYITDATDTQDPTYAIMFDPATNEVIRSKRRLVAVPEEELKKDQSRVRIELDAKNNASYVPENITTVGKFSENMEAAKEKIHEVWVDSLKEKVKKEISKIKDSAKRKQVEFVFDDVFNKAKDPSIDSIASVFNMNKKEATVASIVMKTLGFSPEDHLLRIVKSAAGTIDENATANIVLSGTRAIIQSTKESDLGSIAHEMGHYHRFTFIGRSEEAVKARHAAGITDSEWKKFTDWVGNEEEIWSTDPEFAVLEKQAKEGATPELRAEARTKINNIIKAEEKFANGWATFVKNLMSGKGKAPSTAIQRLFHRLGDHLGNLGDQFKTQEALEAGIEMTPEASAVYEKFMNRNNDKISEFFDVSYRRIFSKLPADQRNAIGVEILGEAQFNDYKAKMQRERAEARLKTDPLIAGGSAKRIPVSKLVDDIKASIAGSPTKKLIRQAIDAGLTKDSIIESMKTLVESGESSLKNPVKLNLSLLDRALTSEMKKIPDDVLAKLAGEAHLGVYEVTIGYKVELKDNKLALNKTDKSVTRDMAVAELNRRTKASEPKVESATAEDILSTLDELSTSTGFVDSAGLPVHLTGTEATAATLRAIEREEAKASAETAFEVARSLEEATDVSSVSAVSELLKPKEEAVANKVLSSDEINVEEDVTRTPYELEFDASVRRLREVQRTARDLRSELSPAAKEQLDNVVMFLRNNTEGTPALIEAWKKFQETENPTAPRPPIAYLVAELKNVIAKETLDGMVGLDDAALEAFVRVREDVIKFNDMKEVEIALREPTPENISAMSKATGISEDRINLFLLGDKHIKNQLEIAEYNKASSFVKDNAINYEVSVKYLDDNKEAYTSAKSKEKRTPEEESLFKEYNGKKAFVKRFDNCRKRISIGRLGESVVDQGAIELAKANSLFEVANIKTYSTLADIFYARSVENIDITDLLDEFDKSPQTMNSIARKLGASETDDPKSVFLAWASGKDSYNELSFSPENKQIAKRYVRSIIKNLDENASKKGTKKRIFGLVQRNRDGDEVTIGEQMTTSGRETESLTRFSANNESALLTYTAGIMHERLVKNGKQQLAEYFAARRATYWLPGNREDNLRNAFNLRANELGIEMLTEKDVVKWETELRSEFEDFANNLRLHGLDQAADLIMTGELNLKEVKTKTVLNQGSYDSAISHLDMVVSDYMDSGNTAQIKPELLSKINSILSMESAEFRNVMSDVIYGKIKNGSELLDSLAKYKHTHSKLVEEIKNIPGSKEILDNVLVMAANDKHGIAAYHSMTSTIGLNAMSIIDEDVVLHEIFHALTSHHIQAYEISKGLDLMRGEEYIDAIRDMVANDQDLPPSLNKLYTAYLRYIDSGLFPAELRKHINNFSSFDNELATRYQSDAFKYYGGLNLEEFVAEGMTQPQFMKSALLVEDNQINDKNAFKDLFTGMIEIAGLQSSPKSLQIASSKLLKSIQAATVETIMDPENRLMATTNIIDLAELIPDNPSSEEGSIFFRLGRNNTINPIGSFVDMGKDPRTTPVIFNQASFVPPEVNEQLKLRDDLKASKGRIYKQMRILNQDSVHVQKIDEGRFTVIGKNLGSNKARQLLSPNETKYYAKEAKSLSHAENEVLAQMMYKALGFKSVSSNVVEEGAYGLKGPMLMSKWLTDVVQFDPKNPEHVKKGQDLFVASAWLANWDIMGGPGSPFDNADANGVVLDTGGSLKWRAMGGPKGDKFGPTVVELKTFKDAGMNPSSAKIFGNISDIQVIDQAKNLKDTMTDEVIDKLVDGVITDKKEAIELKDILKKRRDYIVSEVLKGENLVSNSIENTNPEVASAVKSVFEDEGFIGDSEIKPIENKKIENIIWLAEKDIDFYYANEFEGSFLGPSIISISDILEAKNNQDEIIVVGGIKTIYTISCAIDYAAKIYKVSASDLVSGFLNAVKETSTSEVSSSTWKDHFKTSIDKITPLTVTKSVDVENTPTIKSQGYFSKTIIDDLANGNMSDITDEETADVFANTDVMDTWSESMLFLHENAESAQYNDQIKMFMAKIITYLEMNSLHTFEEGNDSLPIKSKELYNIIKESVGTIQEKILTASIDASLNGVKLASGDVLVQILPEYEVVGNKILALVGHAKDQEVTTVDKLPKKTPLPGIIKYNIESGSSFWGVALDSGDVQAILDENEDIQYVIDTCETDLGEPLGKSSRKAIVEVMYGLQTIKEDGTEIKKISPGILAPIFMDSIEKFKKWYAEKKKTEYNLSNVQKKIDPNEIENFWLEEYAEIGKKLIPHLESSDVALPPIAGLAGEIKVEKPQTVFIKKIDTSLSLSEVYSNYNFQFTQDAVLYDGLDIDLSHVVDFLSTKFGIPFDSSYKFVLDNKGLALGATDVIKKFYNDFLVYKGERSLTVREKFDAVLKRDMERTNSHDERSIYKLRSVIQDIGVRSFGEAIPYIKEWIKSRELGVVDLKSIVSQEMIEGLKGKSTEEAMLMMQSLLNNKTKSSSELRTDAFKVIARIYSDFSPIKLTEEQRAVKFREFFTDADGNDIMWKDDFGIPVLFHRGHRDTVPSDLVRKNDPGTRFWGENVRVARDYHGENPIISAYLAAPKKNVLVVKNPEVAVSWSMIPKSNIIDALVSFGYTREKAREAVNGVYGASSGTMSIDNLTSLLQLTHSNYHDPNIWAIKVENLTDLTKEGGKGVPHAQWTIRADMNIMKSPEAIEFDKTPGPMKILNQKRAEDVLKDGINSAKAAGASAPELEAELSRLVDTASIRRRDLLEMKLNEETEPEDLEVINSMIKGVPAFQRNSMSHLNNRMGIGMKKTPMDITTKFKGRSYRDLSEDERRSFVLDVLMPKISQSVGDRNSTAGVFSVFSDSVVGKGVNSRIGGAARYGDTADSSSMGLQFLSKILDPTMDLRNGELEGTYNLFSMDMLVAEATNMYSRSGLLAIKNKVNASIKDAGEIAAINDAAWKYAADIDKLPSNLPHRELVVELIGGIHKYNKAMGETLNQYGNLLEPMDPLKYGTIHKINNLAVRDQEGFVKALTDHVLKKVNGNKEISVVTADALGWLKITREQGATDDIVSIEIPKESPLAVLGTGKMEWNGKTKALFGKDSVLKLSSDAQKQHAQGLVSSDGYTDSYKRLYSGRGADYTAVKQSMTIAKDRYIGIEDGDTKTGKPRSESVGSGRNYNEERILTHSDIALNPDLSKYFQSNVYDLINQHIHSQLTDTLMTKYITEHFGTKMSWLDLVSILSKYGEESQNKTNLSLTEQQSRTRGYDRMKSIWESHIGKMSRSKDGLDRFYEDLMTNSRTPVLAASGVRAALSSVGEVGRSILTSNHHRGALAQVIPNVIKTMQLFSKDKRRTIQEISSATHWLRNMSSDHLLARSEVLPDNPFAGAMLGTRQGGWFKRWAEEWRAVSDINKSETSIVNRSMNRLGIVASRLGAPLAWVNDITTTLHVWNAQENFTKNSATFLRLAEKLQTADPTNLADFNQLAKRCGLSAREALNLSTSGLLNPDTVKLMIESAKDQKNYTDGLLDVQKLYVWAGEDKTKIEAINRMGAYINMTARQTNTDPTLLDLRINQSAFAKSMGVFMQFLLSHSVQEIGRRRRYSTTSYGKHLAGLFMMEALTYSLARTKQNKDKWIWEEASEKPIDLTIRLAAGMPMLGSYQFIGSLMRQIIQNTYNSLNNEKTDKFRLPDLYSAPAENLPNKALETFRDLF